MTQNSPEGRQELLASIKLEPFSAEKAVEQGQNIRNLVRNKTTERWLSEFQPGTVARYEYRLGARKSVARVAESKDVQAYVIRQDKYVRGIATMICNQTIDHPWRGEFEVVDLDYWLAPSFSTFSSDVHEAVGDKLFAEYGKLNVDTPAIATTVLTRTYSQTPRGLIHVLPVRDALVTLNPGSKGDPYEITRPGHAVSVYATAMPPVNHAAHAAAVEQFNAQTS
jgi:hypothetical protein